MTILQRIFIALIGTGIITVLQTVVLLFITNFVTPNRNLFGFGGGLVFVLIFLTAIWALAYSTALAFINSFSLSIICSIIFGIWLSWRPFQSAVEIYQRPDYFDREYFISDIITICANFIIYPLTALIIWKLKTQYFLSEN